MQNIIRHANSKWTYIERKKWHRGESFAWKKMSRPKVAAAVALKTIPGRIERRAIAL